MILWRGLDSPGHESAAITQQRNRWNLAGTVLSRDKDLAWTANDVVQPALQGCTDIDMGFSPSTNLLPIRRLNLVIGASAPDRAAWVRFVDRGDGKPIAASSKSEC